MRRSSLVPVLLPLCAFATAACVGQGPATTDEPPTLREPAAAAIVDAREGADPALVQRVADLYNTGENGGGWDLADAIYTPDVVIHTPEVPGVPSITDLASLKASPTGMLSNLHVTLDNVFGARDKLVGRFTATATWLAGVPAPTPYVNPWIVIFRFENGRIAEEWWEFDTIGVMEQLGSLPRTRSAYGWSAPSALTGDPGHPQQNASLARRAVQVVNTGNLVLANQVLSTAFVNHDPVMPLAMDRATFEAMVVNGLREAFPDIQVRVEDVIAGGDRVAVRFTAAGTQMAPFFGIPATGRHVEWTGIAIYRIADGRIVEAWWAGDTARLLRRLRAP